MDFFCFCHYNGKSLFRSCSTTLVKLDTEKEVEDGNNSIIDKIEKKETAS